MEGTVSGMPDGSASEGAALRSGPADEPAPDEIGRLESLLAERAARCRDLAAEVQRRGELCRDLARQLERPLRPSTALDGQDVATGEVARLLAERDRAEGRALEAEAARALLVFERDEALGRVAALPSPGGAEPALAREHARLDGACRGLEAALAEAQEARDVLDARLLLAQQDLEETRAEADRLRRELAEAREQHEVEGAERHTLRARCVGFEQALDVLHGERAGLAARATEAEQALQAVSSTARVMRERLARVKGESTELETEVAELKVMNATLGRQLDEAEVRVRQERERLSGLQAEIIERDHVIARVETDLSLAQVEIEGLRRGVESLDAQREVTEAAAQAARTTAERVRETARHERVVAEERVDEVRAALHDARDTLEELRGVLGSVLLGSVASLDEASDFGTRPDQQTLPGVSIDLQAFETRDPQAPAALDRKDAEISETRSRVASLLETLEIERGRLRAVETTVRTLRPLIRDPEVVRRLDELLQLLGPSSPTS